MLMLRQQVHLLRAFQSRPFALLWIGQTVSRLGNYAYLTALAWTVLLLTGSGTAMGLVLLASSIPNLVFLLLGGVAADRFPRRLVVIWSDVGRGVAAFILTCLAWSHLLQLSHLVGLAIFGGFVGGFFQPAYQALFPQLVETEILPSANALNSLSFSLGQLLGPLLGAGGIAVFGPAGAFAFDTLTFFISALCLLAVRLPTDQQYITHVPPNSRSLFGIGHIINDIKEGLTYLIRILWLWVTTVLASLGTIGLAGPLAVTLPKLVHDVYRAGVWLLASIGTAGAVGAILAALLVGQLHHLRRRGLVAYSVMTLPCLSLILFGLPWSGEWASVMACTASLLFSLGSEVFGIIWITLLQERVPSEKQGRIISIDQLGSLCLLPAGYALTGVLTDRFGPSWVFIMGGTLTLVLVGAGLCVPDIRHLD